MTPFTQTVGQTSRSRRTRSCLSLLNDFRLFLTTCVRHQHNVLGDCIEWKFAHRKRWSWI